MNIVSDTCDVSCLCYHAEFMVATTLKNMMTVVLIWTLISQYFIDLYFLLTPLPSLSLSLFLPPFRIPSSKCIMWGKQTLWSMWSFFLSLLKLSQNHMNLYATQSIVLSCVSILPYKFNPSPIIGYKEYVSNCMIVDWIIIFLSCSKIQGSTKIGILWHHRRGSLMIRSCLCIKFHHSYWAWCYLKFSKFLTKAPYIQSDTTATPRAQIHQHKAG